ncbi:MAG: exodeoxyribonuclease VII large subunit [Xanthomonadales bacterium]|nr:exodeoxyribonuclease VII large subunit [Xanthomonadales bacterium]
MELRAEQVYTPSELNREVRIHLEAGFPRVLVEAEISNLSRPASGHLYFTLKDDRAQIRCALFRSAAGRLAIRPANGMKVLARGRISLYEARGDFQLILDSLQDAGEGELQRQFEALKKRLEREGLFEAAHKQPLPRFPYHIALITSASGAAVRDLLQVLERRWPLAQVRLYAVPVQGSEAPPAICRAIAAANRHGWAELLIVGRGGGSLEDLAAFNDEAVARAVFASATPTVSAVGHETDFSICDFVADLRAPTPSAAAELATPDQHALHERFEKYQRQLRRALDSRLIQQVQKLDHLSHRLQQKHPALQLAERARALALLQDGLQRSLRRTFENRRLRLDSLSRRLVATHPQRRLSELARRTAVARANLDRLMRNALRFRQQQLRDLARTLNAVSPLQTIGRGYAVLLSSDGQRVISSVAAVESGDALSAQLQDGRLECRVTAKSGRLPGEPEG